ncbi:MAG: 3-phosphoshikimate 1-carboxyvinyltransferase [Bacteroidales bacterium]|nr:3-phosphoshikimate 1-carboxyvinyltransferase [Bacteroidales bacterium]
MSSRHIAKGNASGSITAPHSKSYAHRLLLASFLSQAGNPGETLTISGIEHSEDISATLDCIAALGGNAVYDNGTVSMGQCGTNPLHPVLNCRESGSTLRFFIPVALAMATEATFTGTEKLLSRGISVYEKIFETQGICITNRTPTSITISGHLRSGYFQVEGNSSSQFITGLLFALPLLEGNSIIDIIPPVQSRSYIDITLDALNNAGIQIEARENKLIVGGGQRYLGANCSCEGDWSNAAFLDFFNHIGGAVIVGGLREDSLQGDKVYKELFEALESGFCTIDLSNCIDLGPVLFTMAAIKHGALFTGTRRLRIKESDRVADMCAELSKIGAKAIIREDSVEIHSADISSVPQDTICFESHNDHRIAMSLSVLSTLFGATVNGSEAVCKSYPGFYDDLASLNIFSTKK